MRSTRPLRLEDLNSTVPAYTPGENPATRARARRAGDLLAAKQYLARCILGSAGHMHGYAAARAIQSAATKEELIAQLDAVCTTLRPHMRAVAIGRMVDRALVLLGEAG
jgi:hypothetical protein